MSAVRFERIYPPTYTDVRYNPRCPDCSGPIFYLGLRLELDKLSFVTHRIYQCCSCHRVYKEVIDNGQMPKL